MTSRRKQLGKLIAGKVTQHLRSSRLPLASVPDLGYSTRAIYRRLTLAEGRAIKRGNCRFPCHLCPS